MLENGAPKPVRWTPHALDNLLTREINRQEVERTLEQPDRVVHGEPPRTIFMRRYHDAAKGHDMLMRVVVEETATERVVVTVVKASRIDRYLRGQTP
jgi:hypothetical protein